MSSDDRPATKALKDRWNNLLGFWEKRRRGPYDKDLTEWRMGMGLTPKTAKEHYWEAGLTLGIIRIVYEKKQKFWQYCDSPDSEKETLADYVQRKSAEKKQNLSAKERDFFERMEIREKMEAGPCKNGCTLSPEADCRRCSPFLNLKYKNFEDLEEE